MKRYISLLLALVLVLSLVPGTSVFAAETQQGKPDVVDFDSMTVGDDLAAVLASGTTMATVSDTKAKSAPNSAYLEDTSATSAALLRYQVESADMLSLDFDVMPVTGAPQFRILNGVRGTATTAFWIGFENRNVSGTYHTFVKYYDGAAWVDLYQFTGTLANKWHSVHVDADVNGVATIYVDNVKLGDVPRCDKGDYGDAATTAINAVVFEVGNAGGTGNKSYFDNIKLVPIVDSFYADFEELANGTLAAPEGGAIPGHPFSDPHKVNVINVSSKTNKANKALFLKNVEGSGAAAIRASVKKADALNIEFNLRTQSKAAQFYITNGARATANTLYWLQINGMNVQYYDAVAAKWVTLYTLDAYLTTEFHPVRIEATMTGAKIYIDGVFMGEALPTGGAYGTAVNGKLDSICFVSGAAAGGDNANYIVDDVKLASLGGVDENFEDANIAGSAAELPGYVQDAATAVITDPTNADNQVLYMGDEAQIVTPTFEYAYDFYDKYTLEMDVFIPKAATVTYQIYDGRGGEENTAYILSFNHAHGLRVFAGSYDNKESQVWNDLNEEAKLVAGQWNKIRFEVNTMEDGEVIVYLNDELVGNTDIVYHKQDQVYGVQMSLGAETQVCYVDNITMSPAAYTPLTTPSVSSDFEAMEVGAVPGAPVVNAGMATIATKANGDATENKAIFLEDTSESAAAVARFAIDASTQLNLDAKYLGWSGALQMYITSGARSTANTAYWIQISGKYVQYYDGTAMQTIKELENYLTSWSDIRVEATLDSALVYVNGELVGEAFRAGGTYGTAVTDSINSVTFVCGSLAGTVNKYYIDDVTLTGNERYATVTPTFASDCEDMEVGVAPTAPFGEPKMAVVAEKANGKTSAKAIFLEDTATNAAASVRAYVEKSSELDLEFKVQTWSGAVQMYISEGTRSIAKTAFWVQIYGKYIQYYDGAAWQNIHVLEDFLSGWNTVRVVANMNTADIYLNGELLGTAQRAGVDYGTDLTDSIDSVTFVCGSVSGTENKYYIDDVVLTAPTRDVVVTPEATVVDFESVAQGAPVTSEDNAAAVITADPVNVGGKSLYLSDADKAKAPYIDYTFQAMDKVAVELDVLIPSTKNSVSFQLFNATKDSAGTAFWFQFNYASGLRFFVDGKWQEALNAGAKLSAGTWHKIRFEMIAGENSIAKVYLDGEEVGTTKMATSVQDVVHGLHIYAGSASDSCYIDNVKVEKFTGTIEGGEDDSIDGIIDTEIGLMLEKDVTVDSLTIEPGVTLDLNGHTLTVENLVCFGTIIDSSEANSGLLVTGELNLYGDMTYMPIAVDGGYKFFAYELKNLGARKNANGSVKYGFAIDFANADAYALLSGVDVTMTLAWGENSQTVAFSAELVKKYGDLQVAYPALDAAMILTVSGLDSVEAGTVVSVTPAVTAAGATATGEAMVYTVA